jgi:hypothetical protein
MDYMQNYIPHPVLNNVPLFLSFDFCRAIKNSRNLFLDHDMCSSAGVISSEYLTKKHLYPSNFDKMNVLRAVQIFSSTVTSSLQFLKETEDSSFQEVEPTIIFMETMYKFFQIHNVSNRTQYIRSFDSNIAPYVDISDERLSWLHATFTNYIDDIQSSSSNVDMRGLSDRLVLMQWRQHFLM